MQLVTSQKVSATAFQKSVARQLVGIIRTWTLDEVLTQTERLRAELGLDESRLMAAICGESDVVVIIDGGTFDSETASDLRAKMEKESGSVMEKESGSVGEAPRVTGPMGLDLQKALREDFERTEAALQSRFQGVICRSLAAIKPNAPPHSADSFLIKGIEHMQDRAEQYDAPEGERSMEATVSAFNAVTGCDLSETEGWTFMQMLKMVRANQGGRFNADHYEDLAAYAGLCGEAAARRQRRVDAGDEGVA